MDSDTDKLRNILQSKTWFGFDLDDTLHEFRKASRAATTHCLTQIANKNQPTLEDLQERYSIILRQGTADAFTDGKTSHDYRRARFTATLGHFGLDHDCCLKPGAISLLQAIKRSDRKIVVITEGPQDAQERAVRDLGIQQYIDFLATTNFFGVSKISGLFAKVLDHVAIQPHEMVYIGDSQQRDVEPATKEGIYAIHLDEDQTEPLVLQRRSVNSLDVVARLI
jgi:putative hydrolase of the HAD superfamily